MKILIFRILGNDLNLIHGEDQTYVNLKFTLEKEILNSNENLIIDKIYLLNRIYNKEKSEKIKNLLNEYHQKYLEIPFIQEEFYKIPFENKKITYTLFTGKKFYNKEKLREITYPFNLYLINNNGSRNFCLNYGYQNNYDWILPLDSNAFFTPKQFNDFISSLHDNLQGVFLPQIRVDNNNLKNQDILNPQLDLDKLITFEPQIAFHKSAKIFFNEKIPYGYSPKRELINAITKSPNETIFDSNNKYYNLPTRNLNHLSFVFSSSIFRLSSFNPNNTPDYNFKNRSLNIYQIVKKLKNI